MKLQRNYGPASNEVVEILIKLAEINYSKKKEILKHFIIVETISYIIKEILKKKKLKTKTKEEKKINNYS